MNDPASELTKCWDTLVRSSRTDHIDAPIRRGGPYPLWWDAAMQLMVVADEACMGIGFLLPLADNRTSPNFAFDRYREYLRTIRENRIWPGGPTHIQFPTSLCSVVPACKLCVQPKTHTVQVGCTINNLSHHVALLPPHSQVRTEWRWGLELKDIPVSETIFQPAPRTYSILVVPFPYCIGDSAFVTHGKCSDIESDPAHFFGMKPTWLLDEDGREISPERFVDEFLVPLIEAATADGYPPDWLVLPELALTEYLAREVATLLADKTGLELFISGIGSETDEHNFARNQIIGSVFGKIMKNGIEQRDVLDTWIQSKHHRWKLEKHQIEKYGLGGVLDPTKHWWEGIELYDRTCIFWVFEGMASLATLICEDLARIDPVQRVLRAVGANLVIALLMDDEQETYRWSTRYATALAEDPGSSVLSITSLGLIHRACARDSRRTAQAEFKIAVWREAPAIAGDPEDIRPDGIGAGDWEHLKLGRALPLSIERGRHALSLTMGGVHTQSCSLDGRSDQGMTYRLRLLGKRSITHPAIPGWAQFPT